MFEWMLGVDIHSTNYTGDFTGFSNEWAVCTLSSLVQ